jgi:hypothetical protein
MSEQLSLLPDQLNVRPTHMVFTTGQFMDPRNRHDRTLCGIRTNGDKHLPVVGSHAAFWPQRLARTDFVLCAECVAALEAEQAP